MDDPILALPEAIKNTYVESFDYPDAKIEDLVQVISKMTGKNFILDPKVRGQISIIGPTKVTVQDAYYAFLTALEMNNLTIVPEGKYLKIVTSRNALKSPIPVYGGDYSPPSANYITRLYPLVYIDAENVRREFATMITPAGKIVAYEPTNSLIITDTGSNIQRLITILELLDVPGFQERMEVIPIQNASAADIASLIDTILEQGFGAREGQTRTRGTTVTAKKTSGGGVISKIIADDRTNSLIVLANDKGLEELKGILAKLDTGEASSQSGNIHVYYCQYANSEELSKTLSSVISSIRTTGSRARSGIRPRPAAGGTTPEPQAVFEGDIKITSDKPTNALVITANRNDFESLQRVLAQLDVPRNQVFVEAVFLEVEVGKGTKWDLSTNVSTDEVPRVTGFVPDTGGLGAFLSRKPETALSGLSGFVLGFTAGKKVNLNVGGQTVTIGSIQALLKFIESFDYTNVLSRPNLLAMDNQEASINITDSIPTSAGSTITGTGLQQSNITTTKTGIQLKITPQINAATGYVRLQLAQSVSEPSNRSVPSGLQNVSTGVSSREATTTVVVKDSDTVVIGGLMRDKESDANQKVPLIGDLPILGWLFKSAQPSLRRTNLLMFITPHVIYGENDSRRLRQSLLMERDEWLRKNRGGQDVYEEFATDLYNNDTRLARAKRLEKENNQKLGIEAEARPVPVQEPVPERVTLPSPTPPVFQPPQPPASQSSVESPPPATPGAPPPPVVSNKDLKSQDNSGSSSAPPSTMKEGELLELEF
jgi:general secretion pathway protein D